MAVPYTFATQTTSIPLAELDTNFSTPITIGTTAIPLGNVAPILENVTLGNVTIASGNVTLTNISVINATITQATITTANVTTANITSAFITTANVTTANITTANVVTIRATTANIATANVTAMEAVAANVTTLRSTTINVTTANVTTAFITTANIATANVTAMEAVSANVTTIRATTANVTTDNVTTAFITTANIATANVITLITTGNTILGDATTDTLTVGVTGIVKDASGNVGIGTATTTGAKLTVNANTVLPATAPPTGTNLWVTGADATANRLALDAFGNASTLSLRRSNGTSASPTALQLNDNFGSIGGYGYGATGYTATTRANINFIAAENWTDTAQGAYQRFDTTAIGTNTATERMRIDSSGNLLLGSTSATGTGALRGSYGTGGITTNFAAGDGALNANTSGANNAAIGVAALYSNTTGNYNSAVGEAALYSNTTGFQNSAMGALALNANSTGNYNSAVGDNALKSNTTGSFNSAVGEAALYYNTASNNTAVGFQAMFGASGTSTGTGNAALGYQALYANTTGTQNTALGYAAGYSVTGSNNTLIGLYRGALTPVMTTGSNWTVLSDGQENVKLAIDTNSAIWAVNGQPFFNSPTPTAKTTTATLTGAELLTGIITYNGLALSLTMPLGSALDTAITATNMPVDRAFEFVVINTGAATVTMAVNTGVTFVGVLTVLALTSARWRVRKTAASTFIVYRVA